MRGVSASIHLGDDRIDPGPGERICIMFTNPDLYIHGTRAQLFEFSQQIAKKAETE